MTSHEIAVVKYILERKFGAAEAQVAGLLLELGEQPVRDLYRRTRRLQPRLKEKTVERCLGLFFENGLLMFTRYPDMPDDEPFISIDMERVFFLLLGPLFCYAVEDILGDDFAQVLSVVIACASATVEELVTELGSVKGFTRAEAEKAILQLLRARIVTAWDPALRFDSDDCRLDSDSVAKKQAWTKAVIKVNCPRLYTVYLLYLMQARVEADPAVGPTGSETFFGLCRASLFSTPRVEFLCDEWFQPVTAEEVLRHLPDSAKEGADVDSVKQGMASLVYHIDGFVTEVGTNSYVVKGSEILGIFAEQFLFDVLKAEMPYAHLARAVMQYLIRNHKPYVQAKALDVELFGSAASVRYAVNELARLGFIDLMGTSHVATFEPCRTEHFVFVNLPRLYRQKLQYEQVKSVLRNAAALQSNLEKAREKAKDPRLQKPSPTSSPTDFEADIRQRHEKMELGYLDCFLFSVMYVKAAGMILTEECAREAYTLVEFYNRKPIPQE